MNKLPTLTRIKVALNLCIHSIEYKYEPRRQHAPYLYLHRDSASSSTSAISLFLYPIFHFILFISYLFKV